MTLVTPPFEKTRHRFSCGCRVDYVAVFHAERPDLYPTRIQICEGHRKMEGLHDVLMFAAERVQANATVRAS